MARPLRIEFAGGLYHVMSRGNERQPIVRDDTDRRKRLDWLRRTIETYGWRLYAFALMVNHEHLFVQTPEPNLSAGMQFLNGSYTGYFNDRHRRVGHLFQGRFKSQLVDEEGYYHEVSRYIHLNPVRAGIVAQPEMYPWSSFPGYQWANRQLPWVAYDRVLREFGRDAAEARRAYARFVRAATRDGVESPFARAVGGVILGGEAFVARVRALLAEQPPDPELPELEELRSRPTLEQIVTVVGERFGQDGSAWLPGKRADDAGRAVAAYLARRQFGYSAGAVARALGYRDHSGVSRAVARVEAAGASLRTTITDLARTLGSDRD